MTIPVQFLARIAIPAIVAAVLLNGNGPEQMALYSKIQETSDKVLSAAKGEGEGPTEFFDYIIIGAGSAGAVLAKRLTESGNDTVLLIDAGGDPNPISEVPMALTQLFTSEMWLDYKTVSRQMRVIMGTRVICWFPRGKALGGSSSVNGLVYNRCNAKDYDKWAEFTNDPIWRFDSVVDAFRAVENYHGFFEDTPGPNHGTAGEIHIGRIEFLPGVDTLLQALTEAGYAIGDLNSGLFPSGFSKIDYNIKDGLRWSTYHGFIEPILGRENLKVYRYALATKIHLDAAKRAVGVTYSRHGQSRYVGANKEIILAAGVVDSPKLLMLSGIGPQEHLAQHGIQTILDLPAVGDHLQEHLGVRSYRFVVNTTFGIADYITPETINEYITNATGPVLNLPWYDPVSPHVVNGYFASKTYNDSSWPDLHVYLNEQIMKTEGQSPEETWFMEVELVRTDQTGTIRLASSKPEDFPLIDPRFLQDPMDTQRMVEGIEEMVDFFLNSPTFQAMGIKWRDEELTPGCEDIPFPSTEHWKCHVEKTAGPALHPTSTCRMGPNSSVAVVDSRLRVYGATGLRVIDSSVIPFVPNGNTNLPSIMVGEMGARIILNQI